MRKRWFTLVNAETESDSATVTKSLIGLGKIYALRVNYKATNGATSNTVGNIHSMVSKLQILDGARVLHSLSMPEEIALNYYMRRAMPSANLTQAGAGVLDEDCFIDFALHEFDDEHYIDMANYLNPTLAFTHASTISATAGFATGTTKLTVEALLAVDNPPATKGFLMSKEISSFTAATSGDNETLIQLDFPIQALMALSGVNTKDPTATLTNFKLASDNDLVVYFNRASADVAKWLVSKYAPARQTVIPIVGGTAQTIISDLYFQVAASYGEAGPTAKAIITALSVNQATAAQTTGETVETKVEVLGYLPMGAFYFPIAEILHLDDLMDPTQFKKLSFKQTQGAAQSVQITTHQIVPR